MGAEKNYGIPTVSRAGGRLEMLTAVPRACMGMVCSVAKNCRSSESAAKVLCHNQSITTDCFVCVVMDHEFSGLWAIRPGGSGELDEDDVVWVVRKNSPRTPSFLLFDKRVLWVADNGIAVCVDAKSGEMVWSERLGGNFSASSIYADSHASFFNHDTTTTVIQPGREYKELAKNRLDGQVRASPTMAGKA